MAFSWTWPARPSTCVQRLTRETPATPKSCATEQKRTSSTRTTRRVIPAGKSERLCRIPRVIGFSFSCSGGGLPGGAGVRRRQQRHQRGSGASAEAAENLPEEGLLQDPRRRQVSAAAAPAGGALRDSENLSCLCSETPTSRRSSKPTESWLSSGTPTTSNPRLRKRKQRRSSSTSRRPKRSSLTRVSRDPLTPGSVWGFSCSSIDSEPFLVHCLHTQSAVVTC